MYKKDFRMNKNRVFINILSVVSINLLLIDTVCERALSEVVILPYKYEALDAQRWCSDHFYSGRQMGRATIEAGWHSPTASSGPGHFRCKVKYNVNNNTRETSVRISPTLACREQQNTTNYRWISDFLHCGEYIGYPSSLPR